MLGKLRPRLTYANVMATIAVFGMIGGGAVAIGGVTNSEGEIQACFDKKGADQGEVRLLVKGKCTGQERKIAWSQQGPAGPAGEQGPAGPAGSIVGVSAGGDLTGTYPTPQIANAAVTIPKLAFDPATQTELDALSATALTTGTTATGDLTGTYASPQIGADTVGASELSASALTLESIDEATGAADLTMPVLVRFTISNGSAPQLAMDGSVKDLQVVDAWSVSTSADGGNWSLLKNAGTPVTIASAAVAATSGDIDRATSISNAGGFFPSGGVDELIVSGSAALDANVYVLMIPL